MDSRLKEEEAGRKGRFAASFVGRLTIIVIVSAVVGALLIAYFLERDLTIGYMEAISGVSGAARLLSSSLLYSAIFQVFIAIPILALAVILYTHKVVGPIYRFTSVFREVARGGVTEPSRIRTGDELRGTLESINEMKAELARFIESCGQESEKIERLIEKLESAKEQEKGGIVRELRAEAAQLKELTGKPKPADGFASHKERG